MAGRGSQQTEPFPLLDPAPRTPSSAVATSGQTRTSDSDNLNNPVRSYPSPYPYRGPRASLSPKTDKHSFLRAEPRPLTGAAAMADIRRQRQQQQKDVDANKKDSPPTSPNPAASALHALMSFPGMSRASDAPTPTNLSEPMRKAAEHLTVPIMHTGESSQPSPVSLASYGGHEGGATAAAPAMTATTNGPSRSSRMLAEPSEMSEDPQDYLDAGRAYTAPSSANTGPKAFSYPGPMSADSRETGHRTGSGSSSKRHKCPYCSTDFTRHHNLKSHLLTHSQEKPYVCRTCQSRFRRLHDLKRHEKLHTGERPHTCEKCGRGFARGDALARHNKGPGGCAGRRSSFGGDGDSRLDEDGMEIDYDDDAEDDQEDESPGAQARRGSEPSRKRAHVETPHDAARNVYRDHSSTYPPPASRPSRSAMGPPSNVLPSSSNVTTPGEQSTHVSPAGVGMSLQSFSTPSLALGQTSLTASPKPLSPRQQDQHRLSIDEATHLRNRSPSLTQQFQQHHYGRGSGQNTPPIPAHMPPQNGSQLPSLPAIHSDAMRLGHQTRLPLGPPGPSMLQHQLPPGPASGSNPGSYSSHTRSSGGSMREIVGGSEQDIWSYVRSLEQRFSRMQDEYELRMARMQEELINLKQHIGSSSR